MAVQHLTAQKDVLAKLKGGWPFVIRFGVKGKHRPYLYRESARCYHQVREATFMRMRQKKLIEKIESVRTHNLCYDVYGLATPKPNRVKRKPKRLIIQAKARKINHRPKRKK